MCSTTATSDNSSWDFAAIALNNLTSNIDVAQLTDADGNVREIPTVGEWEGGFNVLIVGVDNAEGQADQGERDGANEVLRETLARLQVGL